MVVKSFPTNVMSSFILLARLGVFRVTLGGCPRKHTAMSAIGISLRPRVFWAFVCVCVGGGELVGVAWVLRRCWASFGLVACG